jgi:hypothetical protein
MSDVTVDTPLVNSGRISCDRILWRKLLGKRPPWGAKFQNSASSKLSSNIACQFDVG